MHTKNHNQPSSQSRTPISFTSGPYELSGILHSPRGTAPFPLVIGCHGLLASADSPKQIALAEHLTTRGVAYFRFDHRGCGRSQGELHEATSFAGRCEDLTSAARMLLSRPDLRRPLGLFGSSFGGAVCLGCAPALRPTAIVTLAAPIASATIAAEAVNDLLATEPYPGALDREGLRFDLTNHLSEISHLQVIHGTADAVVPYDNAIRIHAAAQAPKKLLKLESCDHRVSIPEHQQLFLKSAANWFTSSVR
jgi:alpha-beta hydrolase superfamily lysophospholipase